MIPVLSFIRQSLGKGGRMVRSVVCSVQVLLAVAFTMPGCGKSEIPKDSLAKNAERGGPRHGQLAPEIAREDIDGVPFKLSDYRGKVVVLDFWGHW
jgi:hypothetical protein